MLSTRDKNKITDSINIGFAKLGNANGGKMPQSDDNREPIAWELWVARHVLALANKRKENADKAAIKAGVIVDSEKSPLPAGTKDVLYTGNLVMASVEVRNGSDRINTAKLLTYLANAGIEQELLDKAQHAATTTTRPAHVFQVMLISEHLADKYG